MQNVFDFVWFLVNKVLYLIIILCFSFTSLASFYSLIELTDSCERIESYPENGETESEGNSDEKGGEAESIFLFSSIIVKPYILISINEPRNIYSLREQEISIKYLKPPQLNS